MGYTETDIRIAGEHGELSSIDVEHLIEILKRNSVKAKFPSLKRADASSITTLQSFSEEFKARFGELPDVVIDRSGSVAVLNDKFLSWKAKELYDLDLFMNEGSLD